MVKKDKIAVLCYHKNADTIYEPRWIEEYRTSIRNQTHDNFQIFEMNYGGDNYRIFEESYFESYPYDNFVYALSYLMDKCFMNGYDYVLNTNCDDKYSPIWVEEVLKDIKRGYDVVSSNFCLVVNDTIVKYHQFHHMDIKAELGKDHNIICHPSVIYSKNFWIINRYDPFEIPVEDMRLWQRALNAGYKFFINKNNLVYHRIHNNAICRSENR